MNSETLIKHLRALRDTHTLQVDADPNNRMWHQGRVVGLEDAIQVVAEHYSNIQLVDLSNLPRREPNFHFDPGHE